MSARNPRSQRGAALVVGLIMLVLITVMLLAAMNLSTTNFRAVSNMQFREEAIAAADAAIKERLSGSFSAAPGTSTSAVDLDNDGTTDYSVTVTPTCIATTQVFKSSPSSKKLGPSMSPSPIWSTTWDISATVTDADTGASVALNSGVRVQLNDAEKILACD